ncbi:SDR family oxidoreductase [Actinoplanes aureus]|uniref:SDR family oxidoreductase n=1 Tax=Actinoplanes aureus TaxID=2792083 RepID=A0A931CAY2_9ACTN|nr:SDR family oxidoreductase [Actinoplanes aureus]MBG0562773.1 SDR family oxidoreductase [Actinoplanes aureus]
MRFDSYDRIAIVTGSDSGIGEASAVALAKAGFDVGITYRSDKAGAEETAVKVRETGRTAEVRQIDLSRLPQAADVIDDLAEALGGLGVLVNCAGTGISTPVVDTGYDQWREVLAVDLDGPFLCAQRAARRMLRAGRGGRIINITSVHEHAPRVGSGAYCAAKGGLGLLTKVMAQELAAAGITVNAVAPGEIATPMTGNEDVDPHTVKRPGVPVGRPGDANEVAAVVAMLAGPDAAYVTGSSWVIDGGMLLMGPQAGSHLPDDEWRNG